MRVTRQRHEFESLPRAKERIGQLAAWTSFGSDGGDGGDGASGSDGKRTYKKVLTLVFCNANVAMK